MLRERYLRESRVSEEAVCTADRQTAWHSSLLSECASLQAGADLVQLTAAIEIRDRVPDNNLPRRPRCAPLALTAALPFQELHSLQHASVYGHSANLGDATGTCVV